MGQRKQFYIKLLSPSLLVFSLLQACSPKAIDRSVDPLPVEVSIAAVDDLLFDNSLSATERHERLKAEYPSVYPLYFSDILLLGDVSSPQAPEMLALFTEDEQWKFTEERIQEVFSEMSELEKELEKALGRYKAIFPNRAVPDVYRLNTGYNYGIYPQGDVLAFGAEFYLGADDPMIERLPPEVFPQYARDDMNPEQLLPNLIKSLILVREQNASDDRDLLGAMVFYGKVMYLLHLCIPEVEENLHFAYSTDEFQWCQSNEEVIWSVLVTEELLFSTDRKVKTNWSVRAPFTQGFEEASPGELGWFIGKQMVKDYMAAHPESAPKDLLKVDKEQILKAYRPG